MRFITPGKKPVNFKIDDDLLEETGIYEFKSFNSSFSVDPGFIFRIIPLSSIAPPAVHRLQQYFEKKQIVSTATAFKENTLFPPIEVIKINDPDYDYKVHDGFKRFYASIVVGFTEIPVTIVDWS